MLKRIYINNFRCFENFEFKPTGQPSSLLIGKNGSGKSTLRAAIQLFQTIGRGLSRTSDLLCPDDFFLGNMKAPIHFELEACIDDKEFRYTLSLELPENFKEFRVDEESLMLDGTVLFSRKKALVTVHKSVIHMTNAQFNIDWHVVALPIIQDPATSNSINSFRDWLARMVLISPVPQLMGVEAVHGTTEIKEDAENWADWLSGLLDRYPAAYSTIIDFLRTLMEDIDQFGFHKTGTNSKELILRFKNAETKRAYKTTSANLSDGEKCFFLCAVALAMNKYDGPVLTFWDEPDSHLSLDEVGHFIMEMRRNFDQHGQLIITSHNPETIRRFSDENTWIMGRRSHLEPSVIRPLSELPPNPDLIQRLRDGGLKI